MIGQYVHLMHQGCAIGKSMCNKGEDPVSSFVQNTVGSATDAVDNTLGSAASVVNPVLDSAGLKGVREGLTNAWHDVTPVVDTLAKFTPFAPAAYAYDGYDAARKYGDTGNLGQAAMAGVNGALAAYGMPGTDQTGFMNGATDNMWEAAKKVTPDSWLQATSAPSTATTASTDLPTFANLNSAEPSLANNLSGYDSSGLSNLSPDINNVPISNSPTDLAYNSNAVGGSTDLGVSGSDSIPVSTGSSVLSGYDYSPTDYLNTEQLPTQLSNYDLSGQGALSPTVGGESMVPQVGFGNADNLYGGQAPSIWDKAKYAAQDVKDWMGRPIADAKDALGIDTTGMSLKDAALYKMLLANQPYQAKTQGLQALKGGLTAAQTLAMMNLASKTGDNAYTAAQNMRAGISGGAGIDTSRRIGAQPLRKFAAGGSTGGQSQGALSRYVGGDTGGQADRIPAQLSSGEYVMDADTVASLGDGNNAAGAKKLDQMRQNIRGHKRSGALSQIPPKSKSPEQYLKGKK